MATAIFGDTLPLRLIVYSGKGKAEKPGKMTNPKSTRQAVKSGGGSRLPPWIRVSMRGGRRRGEVGKVLRDLRLHSVCESAGCPNRCECWERGTATFMIMGEICTRNCAFCAVTHGEPADIDPAEAERVAQAAQRLNLRHVVITSVTRDDLADGGASCFAAATAAIRKRLPQAAVEILTSDFGGDEASLRVALAAAPDVFNHNVETCERLTGRMRDRASYRRSLEVLRRARALGGQGLIVKSGFMLGLGETDGEVRDLLRDLRECGVGRLTIGQYLRPRPDCTGVVEYVTPEKFDCWHRVATEEYGFPQVESAPLVRSSYRAERQ